MDAHLSLALAQAIVQRHCTSGVVDGLELRRGGNISTVYEVRCIAPDPSVILKIYPDAFHWKMEKELYVYRLLDRIEGLPTPSVLGSDDSKELLAQNYVLMTALKGQPLSSVATSLSALDLRDIYFQMGALLAKVHGVPFDVFGYITTGVLSPHPTNEAYMRFQFQKKLAEFEALRGDATLGRTVAEYVETHGGFLSHADAPALCHNDYHEGNVLVVEQDGAWRVTGIIDVENAVSADPLLDIAKTDYYAVRTDEAKREGFLAGYGQLPPSWRERVSLYRLYHALELWDWFAAVGNTSPLVRLADDIRRFAAA